VWRACAELDRPDLVLWMSASASGLPVAVEVELTVKGSARLRAICSAWARAHRVAGVLYLVSPEAAGPVAAAMEGLNAAGRVSLLPIDALEEGRGRIPALVDARAAGPAYSPDPPAEGPCRKP
jgi:hypothetical protein